MNVSSYGDLALEHLKRVREKNLSVLEGLEKEIVRDVKGGKSLFAFGSGHSALFALELFHRAGGPSFFIPILSESFLPSAGPKMVRLLENTPGIAQVLLDRAAPKKSEMIWLVSNSGINPAIVEMALQAKKRGLNAVAFTSLVHSKAVPSRHPSGKKLFQLCQATVDLGGVVGDAAVPLSKESTNELNVGPMSLLSGIFLAHSILCSAMYKLERQGIRCVYSSVNTPTGAKRNLDLEKNAAVRDPLLR